MARIIAVVLVGTGLLMVVIRRFSYLNATTVIRETAALVGTGLALLLVVQLVVPMLKILAGCALLAHHHLAWQGAQVVLALDLLTLGISILRYVRASGMAVGPHDQLAVVAVSSILPVYAIWMSSMICLILMFLGRARLGPGGRRSASSGQT
jgi:hypothetical protein